MELALRRAYGFAYGPKIRARAGFGMGFLGDDGSGETDTEGSDILGTVDNSSGETNVLDLFGNSCASSVVDSSGLCPASVVQAAVSGAGASAGPSTGSAISTAPLTTTTTYQITDVTGAVWTCDQNGNCCNSSMVCQQGPPQILTTTPPNATVGQAASASTANQTTAGIVAALAAAAAIAGKTVTAGAGSIQCGGGVAVPSGSKCPGATGTSPCPVGTSLSGTTCVAATGLNTTLIVLIVAAVFVMAMDKKK